MSNIDKKSETLPLVSVIIPCFNMGEFVLESVDSVLAQTYDNFEIIIVNDGSTDKKTIEVLQSINNSKITIIDQFNQGVSTARNNGIKKSKGEFICCLDADDIYDKNFLKKTVPILNDDKNIEIGFVTTGLQAFGESNYKIENCEYNPFKLCVENGVHVASLFRKICWEDVGGYLTGSLGYEDWNFWISIIAKDYKWLCVNEPLFFYRARKESRSTETNKKRLINYSIIINSNYNYFKENVDKILIEYLKVNDNLRAAYEGLLEEKKILEYQKEKLDKELYLFKSSNFPKIRSIHMKIKKILR